MTDAEISERKEEEEKKECAWKLGHIDDVYIFFNQKTMIYYYQYNIYLKCTTKTLCSVRNLVFQGNVQTKIPIFKILLSKYQCSSISLKRISCKTRIHLLKKFDENKKRVGELFWLFLLHAWSAFIFKIDLQVFFYFDFFQNIA